MADERHGELEQAVAEVEDRYRATAGHKDERDDAVEVGVELVGAAGQQVRPGGTPQFAHLVVGCSHHRGHTAGAAQAR